MSCLVFCSNSCKCNEGLLFLTVCLFNSPRVQSKMHWWETYGNVSMGMAEQKWDNVPVPNTTLKGLKVFNLARCTSSLADPMLPMFIYSGHAVHPDHQLVYYQLHLLAWNITAAYTTSASQRAAVIYHDCSYAPCQPAVFHAKC